MTAAVTAAVHQDRPLLGIALMLGFCVSAPLIDVFSKLATTHVAVGQITAARFLVQGLLMLPVVLALRHALRFDPRLLGPLLLRGFFLAASTFCFVSSVSVMPIADALAIAFVEPFIILLWGRLVMKEQVGTRRLMACLVGFMGVLLVIQPSFERFGPMALWPLGTAVSFAFYMLVTRSLSARMHPVPMQFHSSWIAFLMCLPPLALVGTGAFAVTRPEGLDLIWLFGVGAASAVSHMLVTFALRAASSTLLAPLHYFELLSSVILGWLIWRDFPNPLAWTGIAIVIGSGLYIIHRERITARAQIVIPSVPPA